MTSNQRRRYVRWYSELWRLYYAIIIAGAGFAMFGAGLAQHNYLFAFGIAILTVGAVIVLLLFTFRKRRPNLPTKA
ncbi:MAG TPA: hypothetical protein VFW17_05825 [Ktedonobacterales bacterium]|jgi:dipeptide/tripeptide permease|nr:hypothetical protein [Ktedonobacterales bacterium]